MSEMTPTEIVQAFWQAQANGDRQAADQLLAEELDWTVVGDHADVARRYASRDEFWNELIAELKTKFVPGTVRFQIHNIYADPTKDAVITHLHETAKTISGKDFSIDIVTIMTVRHGHIVDCLEFMDLHEVRRTLQDEG